MLKIKTKRKFNKDVKKMVKRGKPLNKLYSIMTDLVHKKALDKKHKNHSLQGEYSKCRECHIEPDWLLIYLIDDEEITFIRTGSHSDLFK